MRTMGRRADGMAHAGGPRARRGEAAPSTEAAVQATPVPSRPLLRGWLHAVCFFLSLPAGLLVVGSAESARGRVGASVYALGMASLFGVSGSYHRRRWSPGARRRMQRLDHAAIYVAIAGSYTPLCLLVLDGRTGQWMLTGAWVAALLGVVLALTGVAQRPVIGLTTYIAFGWCIALALPVLARRLSAGQLLLLVAGGLVYTAGGILLGKRWPDPFPAVFGYHEVWHVLVVTACAFHYVAILSVVAA